MTRRSGEQATLQAERLVLLSELRIERMEILMLANNLNGVSTLISGWLEIEIRRLQRIGKLLQRLQEVPVHLRAAHGTDGFSAGQSILMQRHVPSRSGAICRYADGLVRAKIDAYGCDERVPRQRS